MFHFCPVFFVFALCFACFFQNFLGPNTKTPILAKVGLAKVGLAKVGHHNFGQSRSIKVGQSRSKFFGQSRFGQSRSQPSRNDCCAFLLCLVYVSMHVYIFRLDDPHTPCGGSKRLFSVG